MPVASNAIRFHVHNPDDQSPVLLLLHGWGLNQTIWTPLLPELIRHFRVITLDLPGFGSSEWRSEHSDFDYTTGEIFAAMQAQTNAPFFVAGWSLGGLVATQLAVRFKEAVRGLVTIASSPCFVSRKPDWPGIAAHTLQLFRHQLGEDFQKTLDRFLAVQALGSPKARYEMKAMRSLLAECPEPNPQALAAGLRWLAEIDLREQLPTLECPVLRLYGRLDSLIPQSTQAKLTPLLKGKDDSSVTFSQSAHAPFLTEAEDFLAALINWCKAH